MKYYPVFTFGLISLLSLPVSQCWTKPVLAQQSVNECVVDLPEEKAIIKTTKGKAIRQGNKLKIKTHQGRIIFQNNCNSEHVLTNAYELEAYFADTQYFLVRNIAFQYSDSEYTLVNEKTGTKMALYGFPVFSPDRQRFAAKVIDKSKSLTSIEIYRITSTGLEQEYKDTAILATTKPYWKSNNMIKFQRILAPNSPSISAILQLKKGIWELT
jgi:hypothetical protein